jgi:predicted transcriptional regulator
MAAADLPSPKILDNRKWREFYNAAILELDSTKLPERIAEAEKALVQHARELLQRTGDNIEEEQALDDATYVLQGLRSTFKRSLNMSERNPEGLGHMRTGTW